MRILVTNDDGFDSSGLHALAKALKPFGEVVVAAPDRNTLELLQVLGQYRSQLKNIRLKLMGLMKHGLYQALLD